MMLWVFLAMLQMPVLHRAQKNLGAGESRCIGYLKIALYLKLIAWSHFKTETFGVMSKREFRARAHTGEKSCCPLQGKGL